MGLHLNGQPYELTPEQVRQYSKTTRYLVGKQFITKRPHDREDSREYDIASVHIPNNYILREVDTGNVAVVRGTLTYFESYQEAELAGKRHIYTPAYIQIDDTGMLIVDAFNYELNFFLQNDPKNEVVKSDPAHPQHDPKIQTLFSTFRPAVRTKERMNFHEKVADVIGTLTEKNESNIYVIGLDKLVAIAQSVIRNSQRGDMNVGVLIGYDQMDDGQLRDRLIRLSYTYPFEMSRSIYGVFTDIYQEMNRYIESGIVVLEGNTWVLKPTSTQRYVIKDVPANTDAVADITESLFNKNEYAEMYERVANAYKLKKEKEAAKNSGKAEESKPAITKKDEINPNPLTSKIQVTTKATT